jgi:hypothetical protein
VFHVREADALGMWNPREPLTSIATDGARPLRAVPEDVTDVANLRGIREIVVLAQRWQEPELLLLGRGRTLAGDPRALIPAVPQDDQNAVLLVAHARAWCTHLDALYAAELASEDLAPGVWATQDALVANLLRAYLPPQVFRDATRPVRRLIGPPEQLGLGPRSSLVANLLLNAQNLTPTDVAAIVEAANRMGIDVLDEYADLMMSAATATARSASLFLAADHLDMLLAHVDQIGTIILCDVLDAQTVQDAQVPWSALPR